MRNVTRRKLVKQSLATHLPVAAASIHSMLDKQGKWVKRDLHRPAFQKTRLIKAAERGDVFTYLYKDGWLEWLTSFAKGIKDALFPTVDDLQDIEGQYWQDQGGTFTPVDPADVIAQYEA